MQTGNVHLEKIIRRLVALEEGQAATTAALQGTNARLDVVVLRLDQMVELLRQMVVGRAEFDALERRVERLEGPRS